MLVELELLIQLQALDSEIAALDKRLEEIPKEITALQKEIATEKANLAQAQQTHQAEEKQQRENEDALALVEGKIQKYKEQLMNVKSNDEYSAMQRQIAQAQKEVGSLEEKLLIGMDSIEELKQETNRRAVELKVGEKEIGAQEAELKTEASKLKAERDARAESRNGFREKIPSDTLSTYSRVAQTRNGVGLAQAVDERCQVCMVRFRPQMFQELRAGDRIMQCGSCHRILYYLPESETSTAGT